jgi:hypothetical protein
MDWILCMGAISMKLSILSCRTKKKGLYLIALKYGEQEFTDEIIVREGVVPYIEYSEPLQEILHKDVGEAKNMNRTMFKIYREEVLDYPFDIGDF